MLRLLEGYWPRSMYRVRNYLLGRIKARIAEMLFTWKALAARYPDLTGEKLETYAQLDVRLGAYPAPDRLLPTRLGNRLRAAEDYAERRYGLTTGIIWPRLWGVMPERTQKEITEARGRLNAAVRLFIWSLLFLVWTPWAWYWVIPSALFGMLWGYWRALEAASIYGELLRAAFDLNRSSLYRALRWSLPDNPEEEYRCGRQLTYCLWRGSNSTIPTFTKNDG